VFVHKANPFTGLVAASILILCSGQSLAQSDVEKLRQVRGEMKDAEARSEAYEAEVKDLANETKKLRRRLVGVTARVLEKEAAVNEAEAVLADLEERESTAGQNFEKKSQALVETIAALQILQQNPPPALLVTPGDALDAARSSILLSEIAPTLKGQADELAFKLTELRLIRDAVEDQRLSLLEADKELAKERKGLQKMLAEREKKYGTLANRARAERNRVAQLARTAKDLEQLLASLRAVPPFFPRSKPDFEPRLTRGPGLGQRPRQKPGSGLATSEGLEITLISQARGFLKAPALGRIASKYNRPDGAGGKTKGIAIATQPRAQVIAPFDGEIVFAGEYLGYGQLLIIEAGEGYHLVLSGMVKIDGVVGQRLLAGEPIGTMGSSRRSVSDGQNGDQSNRLGGQQSREATKTGPIGAGNADARSAKAREAAKPHLYFEMRRHGKPFDPEPWIVGSERKVRG
jgi:murein hydrolase activator